MCDGWTEGGREGVEKRRGAREFKKMEKEGNKNPEAGSDGRREESSVKEKKKWRRERWKGK